MDEIIQIEDRYYILATSDRAADCTKVLKQGESFAIFDCHGDIQPVGLGEQGIFHDGTRYLSTLEFRLAGCRPFLLGATVNDKNELLAVDLMNPDLIVADGVRIPRDSIHIFRSKFLWQGCCYEQFRITNFSRDSISVPVTIRYDTDFADIFEVRGVKRPQRGRNQAAVVNDGGVILSYEGLDGVVRRTHILFGPEPADVSASEAVYHLSLEPKGVATLSLTISCEQNGTPAIVETYDSALAAARKQFKQVAKGSCRIQTSNDRFNEVLSRSLADMAMMVTETEYGPYPYAGVPWFSTPFGRDGIITALEMLWMNPSIARGVLSYLSATQAMEENATQDADPGKILHETRRGEMAALGEIPFGRYYGSVDATPLFVVLAGAYLERTGDIQFIQGIWNSIRRAIDWMEIYGDADGDGFVEYARHSAGGLVQQGWKDSSDSVFHEDGTLADPPIALCEVQGYAYDAMLKAAAMAEALGEREMALRLEVRARDLKDRFLRDFWCDDLSTYALALDGEKRPCRIRSSNAGHLLFSGLAHSEHASKIADLLLSDRFFTGWGIRTIAAGECRYNPMSYHNGSIWPHDNAIIAAGLARYGFNEHALRLLDALFAISLTTDEHRLPELFCGFKRRPGLGPILYPLACAPQAWAAASIFLLLQAGMGLSINAYANDVTFSNPALPEFLNEVKLMGLQVGESEVDLAVTRHENDVTVSVLRKEGPVKIKVVK